MGKIWAGIFAFLAVGLEAALSAQLDGFIMPNDISAIDTLVQSPECNNGCVVQSPVELDVRFIIKRMSASLSGAEFYWVNKDGKNCPTAGCVGSIFYRYNGKWDWAGPRGGLDDGSAQAMAKGVEAGLICGGDKFSLQCRKHSLVAEQCFDPKVASVRLICSDVQLKEVAFEVSARFQTKLVSLPVAEQAAYANEQFTYNDRRNKECGLAGKNSEPISSLKFATECMLRLTKARLATLEGAVAPSSNEGVGVDPGKGFDIRGLKVGMRVGHLPKEFNSVALSGFQEMAAALLMRTCSEALDVHYKTCIDAYFDGKDAERPAYGVRLLNVRLGNFADPQVGVGLLTQKYGQPRYSTTQVLMTGATSTYMVWNTVIDLTKFEAMNLLPALVATPQVILNQFPGLRDEGTILIAHIYRVLLNGSEYVYCADILSLDAYRAFRVFDASVQLVAQQRTKARQQEIELMPKPRL